MEILEQLAVALGFATLAGLNLYLTVFIVGMAIRNGWVDLAPQYEQLSVLGGDAVLIASGLFFVLEFFSDKVPWVDSLWDAIHTLIRPVGGGLLAMGALGTVDPGFDVVIALLAGGATLVTHGVKSGTRLVINTSPEPVSNIVASVAEDAAVIGGLALMSWNPIVAGVVFLCFLGLSIYLTPKLFRRSKAFLWFVFHKFGAVFKSDDGKRLYTNLSAERIQTLADSLGGRKPDILWTADVVTGKAKGFKAVGSQTFGVVVAESDSPQVLHFIGRRYFRNYHVPIPLEGAEIVQEPRFLSEDVVIYTTDGTRRLHLRLHSGKRALAKKIVEGIAELRDGAPAPVLEITPKEESEKEVAAVSQ